MTTSVDILTEAARRGILDPDDVDEELFNHCFWSHDSPPPSLLIRTSGEIRLSDFLLWQSSHTVLSFTPVLWPEFSVWHLIQAVFYYQRHEPLVKCITHKLVHNSADSKVELKKRLDLLKSSLNEREARFAK